jgi:hypothetical protein
VPRGCLQRSPQVSTQTGIIIIVHDMQKFTIFSTFQGTDKILIWSCCCGASVDVTTIMDLLNKLAGGPTRKTTECVVQDVENIEGIVITVKMNPQGDRSGRWDAKVTF